MKYSVSMTRNAVKGSRKAPDFIIDKLRFWIAGVEERGLPEMQKIRGYRDHSLKGNRAHQRSVSLNMLWRAIYETDQSGDLVIVFIEEITPHRY